MLYHVSVALDFSEHDLIVGQIVCFPPIQNSSNNQVRSGVLVSEPSQCTNSSNKDIKEISHNNVTNIASASPGQQPNQNNSSHSGKQEPQSRNVTDGTAYKILNSSSVESLSRLQDHIGSTSAESPSEYAASSSPVTSSLSRSMSSFSADSSSIGVSESVSLEAICKTHNKDEESTSDNAFTDDSESSKTKCASRQEKLIDGVIGVLLDCINDGNSGIDGDADNVYNNSSSSDTGPLSESSEASDDGTSASTMRHILKTISESPEGTPRSSSPQVTRSSQVHRRQKGPPDESEKPNKMEVPTVEVSEVLETPTKSRCRNVETFDECEGRNETTKNKAHKE